MKRADGYWCLLFAIAFGSGCGLPEYESKYKKQQERMNYLNEENRYLGKPIELPTKKDSTGSGIRLRLPLGISTNHDEETIGILYHYPKSSSKPPKGTDAKVNEIESAYVAFETTKDWNEFKKRTLEPFKAAEMQTTGNVTLGVPGRSLRDFETVDFTEGTDPTWAYSFYFFKDEVYRVAIGFRGSKAGMDPKTARQAMEFSVKTLAVGRTAEKK